MSELELTTSDRGASSLLAKLTPEQQLTAAREQKQMVVDFASLMNNASVDSVVSALLSGLNVDSVFTSKTSHDAPGSVIINTVLSNYLPGQKQSLQSAFDTAVKFGLVNDSVVEQLVINPEPISKPIKGLIAELSKKHNQ